MARPNLALAIGREKLEKLYRQEEMNQQQIADSLRCSKTAVQSAMVKFGIPRRPPRRGKEALPLRDPPVLESLAVKGYAAASFDCEGTISLHKHEQTNGRFHISPNLRLYNTSKEWIIEMHKSLGCSIMKEKRHYPNGKDVYRLYTGSIRRTLAILEKVHPFLKIKKRQAEIVIEFCRWRLSHQLSQHGDKELKLFQEIQELNERGI